LFARKRPAGLLHAQQTKLDAPASFASPPARSVIQRLLLRFERCEEIDNPNAKAFWRVAPEVRFSWRAIFTTGVF
jgi:hypothetical protein